MVIKIKMSEIKPISPISLFKKSMYKKNVSKKADIWVSTVLYTLIALAIIGTLLAVVRPRIDEMRDHSLILQTIDAMNEIDRTVTEVKSAQGMRLFVEFKLSRGNLIFNPSTGIVEWQLPDSRYQYSEEEFPVNVGRILAQTNKTTGGWFISLKLNYSEASMSVNGLSAKKTLQPSATPYKIQIENKGSVTDGILKTKIDFTV